MTAPTAGRCSSITGDPHEMKNLAADPAQAESGRGDESAAPPAKMKTLLRCSPHCLGSSAKSWPWKSQTFFFIMADDLGWRDLGCFGSTFHQTPNLDKARGARREIHPGLRGESAVFADAQQRAHWACGRRARASPRRCAICHRSFWISSSRRAIRNTRVLVASSVTRLKTDYVTLPKVLHDAGYRTGHFGKWHLGAEPYSPLQHGFDVDWPHWPGPGPAGSYVAPWKFPAALKVEGQPGEHIEDTLVRQVVKFIRENKDRPFLRELLAVQRPRAVRRERRTRGEVS